MSENYLVKYYNNLKNQYILRFKNLELLLLSLQFGF